MTRQTNPKLRDDYQQVYDHTKWKQPSGEMFLLRCCDCHLVHRVTMRTASKEPVQINFRVAPRETSRTRKAHKPKLTLVK